MSPCILILTTLPSLALYSLSLISINVMTLDFNLQSVMVQAAYTLHFDTHQRRPVSTLKKSTTMGDHCKKNTVIVPVTLTAVDMGVSAPPPSKSFQPPFFVK